MVNLARVTMIKSQKYRICPFFIPATKDIIQNINIYNFGNWNKDGKFWAR